MTRAVFFDLGKVLVDFNWQPAFQRVLACSSVPADGIIRWLSTSKDMVDYECGRISSLEFFARAREATGFGGSFDEFRVIWSDIFTAVPDSIALVKQLKGKLPIGVLSNTNQMHLDWVLPRYDFMALFDVAIYSFQEGCMKPHPEIYQRAVKKMKVLPAETFFVDDRPDNVDGALAVGMDAVLFTTPTALRAELMARGIPL